MGRELSRASANAAGPHERQAGRWAGVRGDGDAGGDAETDDAEARDAGAETAGLD